MATLNACPSTRLAANSKPSGERIHLIRHRQGIRRQCHAPLIDPMLSRKRPTTLSSLVVNSKLTAPVRDRIGTLPSSIPGSGSPVPRSAEFHPPAEPLMEFLLSVIWTRFAGVMPVFNKVTLASYGSPTRTVRG